MNQQMEETSWLRHLSKGARQVLAKEATLLESALKSVETEINGLDQRKLNLEEEAAGIRQALSALANNSRGGAGPRTTPSAPARVLMAESDRPNSLVDEIEAIFQGAGNVPLHYRQVCDMLAERGVTVGGREPSSTVLAVLTNSRYGERFARAGRGVYKLAKVRKGP